MKLKFTEHKEAQDKNGRYERDIYEIGNYQVIRDLSVYESGKIHERFSVNPNRKMDYLPEIYFNYDIFGDNDTKEFRIQTTSYGSLSPADIQKVIDGYNEAVKVANVLTDIFLKQEDPQNEKCNLS